VRPDEQQINTTVLSFSEFGLSPEILDGIRDMGYSQATPIQQQAIPVVLDGKDIVASAQTGTGKTAAFVVPILQKILNSPDKGLQCLILSPTRELAQQIDEQIFAIGYYANIPSVTIYGGGDWGEQQKALERGVRIIVATPGRLLDLMKVRNLDFSNIEILVLDEADRMLDMGFIPDVRTIINRVPKNRQTLFFSATIHEKLKPLLQEFLVDPVRISIAPNKAAKGVNQWLYYCEFHQKADLVKFLMDDDRFPSCILFTSTKRGADELARELRRKRLAVASIHGDRTQQEREEALAAFKAGTIRILVATDVLARGIDIEEVSLVINYDVPRELEDYIHRIGRTARADAKGDAITFVSPQDRRYFEAIKTAMGDTLVVLKLPESIAGGKAMEAAETEPKREQGRDNNDRRHREKHRQPERRQKEELPRVEERAVVEAIPSKKDEEPRDPEARENRRHRGGRNRRRRGPRQESSDNSPQRVETETQQSQRRDPQHPTKTREAQNKHENKQGRQPDRKEAQQPPTRGQEQRSSGKPHSRGRDYRGERTPHLGVTHKLPVTNDLSSMSTSLKDPKAKHAHKRKPHPPTPPPEKKGFVGLIKKIFGK
jgi:superfamily II DNA/RNA helicase